MIILGDWVPTAAPIFADALPATRASSPDEGLPREWTWLNWTLSLLTAPAAALLMSFALSRAAAFCNSQACPGVRANGPLFGLLYHGAAGVAALTLFLAFFFATRRCGILVWLGGWILLGTDLMVLLVLF